MSDTGKERVAPRWTSPTGEVISCVEKLKVLRENLDEIRGLCQDAIDDAVLMGCDEEQFRQALVALTESIESAYKGLPEK